MNTSREAIDQALFALAQSLPGILTSSRRLLSWEEVPSGAQPAIFQARLRETAKVVTNQPTIWEIAYEWYLYTYSEAADTAPASIMNPILDEIDAKLRPSGASWAQTLGGIVIRASIEGEVITDQGVLGSQAVAIIPITVIST